jgi:hypothetical protein
MANAPTRRIENYDNKNLRRYTMEISRSLIFYFAEFAIITTAVVIEFLIILNYIMGKFEYLDDGVKYE